MFKLVLLIALFTVSNGSSVFAQDIDCSAIKNNPPSYKRCMDGQKDAARFEREKKRHERRAKLRDAVCVVDAAGDKIAAIAAGWPGKIVYQGTRAAADAISKGASRCPG